MLLLALPCDALVAILAQVAIPLWPVPVTGQTLAVLLVEAHHVELPSLHALNAASITCEYVVCGMYQYSKRHEH